MIFLQPALPSYRMDFFRRLSNQYEDEMRVYYSPQDMGSLTAPRELEAWEHPIGPMLNPMRGVEWQVGALSLPMRRGDTLVVCGAPRNLSMLIVLARARMKGVRTIWWGQYWSATTVPRRHRLRMKLSRLADALLFYTDVEVARFHAEGWTHKGPVGAVNNGLDLSLVRRLRTPYNLAHRGRNLLFIGRLTAKAQLNLAIDALTDSSLEYFHLHIVGDGTEEAALRRRAAARNVGDRITWYGGTANESLIAEIANRCTAFIYPGQVGLSLIHAMGYGLPCIVHNQPLHHMPEIAAFIDGITGVTFSEGNAPALAGAVADLFEDPILLGTMSDACKRNTSNCFNTEHMARRFIEFVDLKSI